MTMSQELWDSLEAIEESINKIVCLKQVITLMPTVDTEYMGEILDRIVDEFSNNQKEVWNQVRNLCEEKDLAEKYKYLYNEHIALEKRYDDLCEKYDNLAYYDSYKGNDSGFTVNMNSPSPTPYTTMNNDTISINGGECQDENFYGSYD